MGSSNNVPLGVGGGCRGGTCTLTLWFFPVWEGRTFDEENSFSTLLCLSSCSALRLSIPLALGSRGGALSSLSPEPTAARRPAAWHRSALAGLTGLPGPSWLPPRNPTLSSLSLPPSHAAGLGVMPAALAQAERAPTQLVFHTQERGRVVQGGARSHLSADG